MVFDCADQPVHRIWRPLLSPAAPARSSVGPCCPRSEGLSHQVSGCAAMDAVAAVDLGSGVRVRAADAYRDAVRVAELNGRRAEDLLVPVVEPADRRPRRDGLMLVVPEPYVVCRRGRVGARLRAGIVAAGVCWYCLRTSEELGASESWVVDHLLAVCRGGATVRENLVLACSTCNLAKGCSTRWGPGCARRQPWTQGPGAVADRLFDLPLAG